jgi:hypothetical protein
VTCGERLRKRARPSRWRGSMLKVGYLPSVSRLSICLLGIRSQLSFSCSWLSGLRTALGNTTTQAEAVQTAYNSSQ